MKVKLPLKINRHSGRPYVEAAIEAAAMAGLNCSELSESQRDLMKTVRDELVSGLVTNSILFGWLFTIKVKCTKCDFTNTQSRFASVVFDGLLAPL